jgi:hypothetical protein
MPFPRFAPYRPYSDVGSGRAVLSACGAHGLEPSNHGSYGKALRPYRAKSPQGSSRSHFSRIHLPYPTKRRKAPQGPLTIPLTSMGKMERVFAKR